MKKLNTYITEKLKIGKTAIKYTHQPKDKVELRKILEERLANDKNANLNDIDVSEITDMGEDEDIGLFEDLDPHNINISDWDVSNVKTMKRLFWNCENLDCDLSGWDVSNVEEMTGMFTNCFMFKGEGLEHWNVSKVEYMSGMFYNCIKLDSNLANWDVSNVIMTRYMFWRCKNFKGVGLEKWDVSNVIDMKYMFYDCHIFDCDLNDWKVSSVRNMDCMFHRCYELKNKPSWYINHK